MRKILKVALFNEERAYTELDLPASPYTVLDALESCGWMRERLTIGGSPTNSKSGAWQNIWIRTAVSLN